MTDVGCIETSASVLFERIVRLMESSAALLTCWPRVLRGYLWQTGTVAQFSRLDALTVFLRILFWFLLIQNLNILLNYVYIYSQNRSIVFTQSFLMMSGALLSISVLGFFTPVVANNAAGVRAREAVTSLADAKSLIAPCVGLFLFFNYMGMALGHLVSVVSSLMSQNSANWAPSLLQPFLSIGLFTLSPFLLGFVLAFGPAIRDGLRARAMA